MIQPLPLAWIDKIWERLFSFYGKKFTDFWGGADQKQIASIKRIWAEDLSGYSAEEIKTGLDKCKENDYPPTMPQFLKMCRPLINYEASFAEAVKQLHLRKEALDNWSAPAIYYAAITMHHELSNCSYASVKDRWRNAIDTAVENIKCGKIPNEVPLVILAPEEIKITPEKAKENLERLEKIAKSLLKKFDVTNK